MDITQWEAVARTAKKSREYDNYYDSVSDLIEDAPDSLDMNGISAIMLDHIFRKATMEGTQEEQEEYLRELIAKAYKGWGLTP